MLAMAGMMSATSPPSAIAGSACRLLNDGSRRCTRNGRVPPSLTTWQPSSPFADSIATYAWPAGTRKPSVTSLKWWMSASMDWLMMWAMWSGAGPRPSGPRASRAGQPILALLDEPQRLVHLVHPDQVPAVRVARVAHRDVELVGLVAAVRLTFPQVPGQPRGAQHRAGDAERHAAGQVQVRDALGPGLEGRGGVEQRADLCELAGHDREELPQLLDRAGRQVLGHPPGADEGVVHAQAGDQLEHVEHLLPLTHPVDEHRGGAELEAEGADPAEVRGDPVQLHQQHPDHARPLRDAVGDPEQFLHGQAVRGLVKDRHQVVGPGAERHALGPGPVLQVLLDAGVQVPDDWP